MKETVDEVMDRVEAIVSDANEEMTKATEGGFPFSIDEVRFSVDSDTAGIYIHSGTTPVVSIARAGDPDKAVDEISERIQDVVDATKTAIERRGSLKEEADAIVESDRNRDKAEEALRAAGLDASLLGVGVNKEAAEAVANAAKNAVREANKHPFIGVVPYSDYKLRACAYSTGIVIMAGNKPVLISRFPKMGSPKAIERTVRFIESDVAALQESRNAYYRNVSMEMEREERLRTIAKKIDASNEELMQAASM